jgi:RHS repeat-associated protein
LKTYAYDDAFRITGITDTTNAALSWTYGYDDLDRLTSASKTGTTLGYSYDANGNRLTQTGSSASTFTVAANSNRLSSTSGALARTYGYDNAGNTTSFTGITFAYNNRGRMKSSTKSSVTTNYIYNALGQLIKKGSNALYYYDDAGHILGIYNGTGALTEEIVWLGDIPIVTLRPKVGGGINIYNIHTDHLNTPRLVTGSVNPGARWRWDADPFGVGVPNNNPTGAGVFEFNLRFPGQIYFAETGLNYNYYRDGYDSAVGRYTQSDPIGLRGGINTYAYAGGNPVLHADPTGLDYWIEGPVKGEGGLGLHQSVCVGQYNSPAGRKCISFGVEDQTTCDGTKCKGRVYLDGSAAGDIAFGRYRRTTAEVDKKISAFFDDLLDREGDYDLINNNCRDFSYRLFRSLEHQFGGR